MAPLSATVASVRAGAVRIAGAVCPDIRRCLAAVKRGWQPGVAFAGFLVIGALLANAAGHLADLRGGIRRSVEVEVEAHEIAEQLHDDLVVIARAVEGDAPATLVAETGDAAATFVGITASVEALIALRPGWAVEADLRGIAKRGTEAGRLWATAVLRQRPEDYARLKTIAEANLVAGERIMARTEDRQRTGHTRLLRLAGESERDVRALTWTGLLYIAVMAVVVRRGQRRARETDGAYRRQAERRAYEASFGRALDMAGTDDDVRDLTRRALVELFPGAGVSMASADSSRAHLVEELAAGGRARACGPEHPQDCPAIARGAGQVFAVSTAIDACPRLTGECSVACVPVNIEGSATAVIQLVEGMGRVFPAESLSSLDMVARRVGERLSSLRVTEDFRRQATSDPLTGLLNRRSLENLAAERELFERPYAVAFFDLDHFKILNDVHGHPVADRALKAFAVVMQKVVRPDDLVGRWGGEEFLVMLPGADVDAAEAAAQRVRAELALLVVGGEVPAFTVSCGIATSEDAPVFFDVVALADQALLQAKADGRDRVVRAHSLLVPENN